MLFKNALHAAALVAYIAPTFANPLAHNVPVCVPQTVTVILTVTTAYCLSSSSIPSTSSHSSSSSIHHHHHGDHHSSASSSSRASFATTQSGKHYHSRARTTSSSITTTLAIPESSSSMKNHNRSHQSLKSITLLSSTFTSSLLPTMTGDPIDCQPNNCLRHFIRHTEASDFCATYTTLLHTTTTGLPALVSECNFQPSSISSACTCINTGIPKLTSSVADVYTTSKTPITRPTTNMTSPKHTHSHHSYSSSLATPISPCSINVIYSTVTVHPFSTIIDPIHSTTVTTPYTTSTFSSGSSSDTTITSTTTSTATITATPRYAHHGW
jgi:hypothetical protein